MAKRKHHKRNPQASNKIQPIEDSFFDEDSSFEDNVESTDDIEKTLDQSALQEMLAQFKNEKAQNQEELLKRHENSVVKIFSYHKLYDYDSPWMPPLTSRSGGSGFIVKHGGERFILTNAHVADNVSLLNLRLADDSKKYTATVKNIDHDCDLAILDVKDPKFWEQVDPLEIGDMPKVRSSLQVYGFPMGGEEFCITEGQVSRVEFDTYVNAEVPLLQAQVSAAINPGNSGGPAIQDGKVVGVAFQGSSAGEGLGYIIPPPVIKHFINDYLSKGPYQGFPDLHFDYQTLESDKLRKSYGLKAHQTGIRIKKVPPLSAAQGYLKEDDVLLELDGVSIKNDGSVETEFNKRVDFHHLINMKQIGDSINANILRDGKPLSLDIPLLYRANTLYYSSRETEKSPTYYSVSGMILMPLTDNFMDDATSFFSGVDINIAKYQEKYKKQPGEEIVFIKQVFAHEKTKDLLDAEGTIIKEVNGKKINNLRDAISAFEGNKRNRPHVVVTKGGDKLIVDKLSEKENKQILKQFNVSRSCSKDLKKPPVFRPGCPEARMLTGYKLSTQKASNTEHDEQKKVHHRKSKRLG